LSSEPEPIYCQPQDVGDLLNIQITDQTKPSRQQVIKIINAMQDQIDKRTRTAWRTVTVTDEYHDLEGEWHYGWGFQIGLLHRNVKDFDYNAGDRVQFWDGSAYADILTSAGLPTGIVLLKDIGVVAFKTYSYTWVVSKRFRFTYRYGNDTVPAAIRFACAKMTAIEILKSAMFWNVLPIGSDRMALSETLRAWQEDVDNELASYTEITALY